jgi:hypothetical protein
VEVDEEEGEEEEEEETSIDRCGLILPLRLNSQSRIAGQCSCRPNPARRRRGQTYTTQTYFRQQQSCCPLVVLTLEEKVAAVGIEGGRGLS